LCGREVRGSDGGGGDGELGRGKVLGEERRRLKCNGQLVYGVGSVVVVVVVVVVAAEK
jgi:hypothetical protein